MALALAFQNRGSEGTEPRTKTILPPWRCLFSLKTRLQSVREPEGAACLPPDCVPWIYIAHEILSGEFEGADRSTVKSLTIGLRGIQHPLCQKALARLDKLRTGRPEKRE